MFVAGRGERLTGSEESTKEAKGRVVTVLRVIYFLMRQTELQRGWQRKTQGKGSKGGETFLRAGNHTSKQEVPIQLTHTQKKIILWENFVIHWGKKDISPKE